MAGADSDVDMSPPTTPTRASLSPILLNSGPTQRSRAMRFTDVESTQTLAFIRQRLNSEVPSPHNPFVALERRQDDNIMGKITLAMEEGLDDTKWVAENPGRSIDIYSKALDEATNRIQEMGIGEPKKYLENTLEQALQILAWKEEQIEISNSLPRLTQSFHAPLLKGSLPCQSLHMPKLRRKKLNFKALPRNYLKNGLSK